MRIDQGITTAELPDRGKLYLATDPDTLIHFCLLSAALLAVIFYISKKMELAVFFLCSVLLAIMLLFALILMLRFVRIDKNGVTQYSLLRRKKTILWKDVCCSGFFFHYTYINRKRKFFYVSTKPIPGGVHALSLTAMPSNTDSFLSFANQRDVESVIASFYPRFKRNG